MTHICVSKFPILGSDNGLAPGRRQAIIWTIAIILSIRPLATNFNETLIEINTFSFKKMHLKMSSAKWRPSCLSLNVLNYGFLSPLSQKNFHQYLWHCMYGNLYILLCITFFQEYCFGYLYVCCPLQITTVWCYGNKYLNCHCHCQQQTKLIKTIGFKIHVSATLNDVQQYALCHRGS